MLSNSGERWLISITDIPEPRQSSSSSRMRSSTGSGRALGPALKLWTRWMAMAVELDDTAKSPLCDGLLPIEVERPVRAAPLPSAVQNNMPSHDPDFGSRMEASQLR